MCLWRRLGCLDACDWSDDNLITLSHTHHQSSPLSLLTHIWVMARNVWINNACFKSGLGTAPHKIVKHYANSNSAQIVSVTKSSPKSPVPIVHFTINWNYLTIWVRSEMGWGGWGVRSVRSDQSVTKRVQSAELCCVTGDNERVCLCPPPRPGLDPLARVRRPPGVWLIYCTSNTRLKQIKPTATVVTPPLAWPGSWLCLLITPSSDSIEPPGQGEMVSRGDGDCSLLSYTSSGSM